ncbi:UNVERIFIED_CONTAM: hypothetical protein HDU68_005817 [Siphonaria sp. JEL0065]|nr:hypothetical protein HDU68_005817 [Siphonaria sp. JEL0065]
MPHVIDGKPVEVKRALPKSAPHGENGATVSKLFIGGIPGGVSDADIQALFAPFGTVVDAYQMLDQNTRASRGFGFVQFESEEAVEAVLAEQQRIRGLVLNGRRIDLKRATPKLKAVNPLFEEKFRAQRLSNPYEIPPPPPPGTLRPQRDWTEQSGYQRGAGKSETSYRERDDRGGRGRGASQNFRSSSNQIPVGDRRTARGSDQYSPPSLPPPSSHYGSSSRHSATAVAPAGMVMVPAEVAAAVGYYAPQSAASAAAYSTSAYSAYAAPTVATAYGQPIASYGQPAAATGYGQATAPSGYGQPAAPSAYGQTTAAAAYGQPGVATAYGQPPAGAYGASTTYGAGASYAQSGYTAYGQHHQQQSLPPPPPPPQATQPPQPNSFEAFLATSVVTAQGAPPIVPPPATAYGYGGAPVPPPAAASKQPPKRHHPYK